ncbi:MAG: phosphatidate cytidylyltransferase [Chitinophagaceae bacterium]
MAFNVQTFKTRALTAIIFVVVMLAGLLWNQWSFFILFSIVHFGCWVEYQKLVATFHPDYARITPLHKYGIMLLGWCMMLYFTDSNRWMGSIRLSEIVFWLGIALIIILPVSIFFELKSTPVINFGYSIGGLLYLSLSLSLLLSMRLLHVDQTGVARGGEIIALLTIFSLWINDTMAYIVGSLIGKTPLSKISPKKTWEGTIGGVILCAIVVAIIGKIMEFSIYHSIAIAVIAGITGTIGDLFESKLKRMAGVKDSGSIMPGHGGFLDRFDSLLFASIFVWIYVQLAIVHH